MSMNRPLPEVPSQSNEDNSSSLNTTPLDERGIEHATGYTPNDFYNNSRHSRASERRDSPRLLSYQKDRSLQRQQYQQYQQYTQNYKSPSQNPAETPVETPVEPHNYHSASTNLVDSRIGMENDEGEDVSDFWQNAYRPTSGDNHKPSKTRASVITMTEFVSPDSEDVEGLPPPSSGSPTLEQKNSLEKDSGNSPLGIVTSSNELIDVSGIEMNVLRDGVDGSKKPSLMHSKSYRPRPQACPTNQIPPGPSDDYESDLPQVPVRRQKSLIRPERARYNPNRRGKEEQRGDGRVDDVHKRWSLFSGNNGEGRRKSRASTDRRGSMKDTRKKKWYQCKFPSAWVIFSRCITCWAPSSILSCFGIHDKLVQQAWREKIALVSIILIFCATVGFLTFGFNQVFCAVPSKRVHTGGVTKDQFVILGRLYDLKNNKHLLGPENNAGKDLTFMFQIVNVDCKEFMMTKQADDRYFPCVPTDDYSTPNPTENANKTGCKSDKIIEQMKSIGDVFFDWEDVKKPNYNYMVYNGQVLDLGRLNWTVPNVNISPTLNSLKSSPVFRSRDITYFLQRPTENIQLAKCMVQILRVGVVDIGSIGCVITDVVTYIALIVIVGVVLVRFCLAVLFGWILSWRLGNFREETAEERAKREQEIENWSNENNNVYPVGRSSVNNSSTSFKSRFLTTTPPQNGMPQFRRNDSSRPGSRSAYNTGSATTRDSNNESVRNSRPPSIVDNSSQSRADSMSSSTSSAVHPHPPTYPEQRFNFPLMHTIMLVTCYSEGEHGLRTTLDSLANTDYPISHKLLMCICDGIICGSKNKKSTPDICLSLMDGILNENVIAHSYVAIADGKKRHNMAKVFAGYYKCKNGRIPMITIIKCGGPGEEDDNKPGNRGKRDSQIILMSFLQKVMFDERMTPLEYEFFNAIREVSGVTPDFFEIVLMVDADTKIFPDSLTRMVACMSRDPSIMGLCGETKIANKSDTWVTMIQVFEYYISHHMQKAFESIFGGVTCLPGCFCMYRVKAPKGPNGYWVPILANPDIVEQYSENVVDTLHKKNLLLLGEDRYLSTLMLRSFPKRKMVFVPQAVCKTIVPDTFRVLRSQRRRWINSTVHNLMELVLIPDLCGTFCFSMQFVIFMELVGTVVLPAAISFTMYLIIISFVQRPVPIIPLLLLAAVLGLPAVLIVLTSRKIVYVGWMIVYLLSLPIWNFVLPVYAYWHFDDFSWGETRMVKGEEDGIDHSRKDGEFDSSQITMKRWVDWEHEKRFKHRSSQQQQLNSSIITPDQGSPSLSSIHGSENSLIYPSQPFTQTLLRNSGRRMQRMQTSDSLILPPPLSMSSSPINSPINSPKSSDSHNASPVENSAHQSHMSQQSFINYRNNNLINNIVAGSPISNGFEDNDNASPRQE